MFKKTVSMILTAALAASVTACGGTGTKETAVTSAAVITTAAATAAATTAATAAATTAAAAATAAATTAAKTTTSSTTGTAAATAAVTSESAGGNAPGAQGQGGMGSMTDYKKDDAVLQNMIAEVVPKFQQFTYTDSETGKTIAYNLYVPVDYDASKSYPLVYYIADSSVVGKNVTSPLTQGYGGIIWATDAEQEKHESLVLVPEYSDVVLDDHSGYTTTDYLEMTVRLLQSVESKYNVDQKKIYATGQSMGCMIFMYLAAEHPDLFAAELFVDGQWDISKLTGLESQKFFYFAAEGDEKASAGQKEVTDMLTSAGIKYSTAEWDATWTTDEFKAAVASELTEGNAINCVQWKLGTVLPEGVSVGTSEHMYSFDHAYTTEGVRDWLFSQTK
jgi:predicted peptidase